MKIVRIFYLATTSLLKNDYFYDCNIHRHPLGQIMKRKRNLIKQTLIKLPTLLEREQNENENKNKKDLGKLLHLNTITQSTLNTRRVLGKKIEEPKNETINFPKYFLDKLHAVKFNQTKFNLKPINRTWRDLVKDNRTLKSDRSKESFRTLDRSK